MLGRGPARLFSLALILGLGLVVIGCQVPSTRARASPTPSAVAVDGRVLAADARLYRGDYDGADAGYRSLAETKVPGAAAHLSTLLAYEGRFEEAVAAAQAGVAISADSDSLARLARALDWSENVDAAVQAGARAVAARPVTALAHAFYSEALADSGRFDEAMRQLHAAEAMGGDAFVQAEVDREWGNYYRGHGDSGSELNYTELAVKAQSGFPERQLDLIRYNYANQEAPSAQALSDKLLAAHPKDYHLLVGVADAALIGGDLQRAPALYRAAAEARPGGPEAAIGQAEVDVALNRDFAGAHDLLLSALQSNPTSSAVYEYLRYLDLLILKKDPAADLAQVAPQRPGSLTTDRKAAVDGVNTQRSALGLPALQEDPALDEAAQAHAYYFLFNASQSQVGGTGITAEDASLPGFTGVQSIDRDRHFGYTGASSAELASHVFTASASVGTSIDSVFHRFPLLDRGTTAVGYGEARIGPLAISIMDVGGGSAAAAGPVAYPADGQSGVPPAFIDAEVPDPLPTGALTPAGYPVTLQVGSGQHLAVSSGRLLGPDGQEVPTYALAPGNPLGANEWALVAKEPLRLGTVYTADVTGTVDGKDFTQRWSFTVASQ